MFKDSMLSLAKAVGSSWGDMLPRFDSQPGESYSGVLNVPGHGELRVTAQGSISSSAVEVVINGKTRQPEVLIHWHGLRNLGAQRAKAELAKLPAMVEQALARSASLPPAPL